MDEVQHRQAVRDAERLAFDLSTHNATLTARIAALRGALEKLANNKYAWKIAQDALREDDEAAS